MPETPELLTPDQSFAWLKARLDYLGMEGLTDLARITEINRGTLHRYFTHQQRPSVTVVGPLCAALRVSPENLLIALGVLPVTPGWARVGLRRPVTAR